MRLNQIAPRWSAPLVSASLMLVVGTVGMMSGCGSGSADKKPDPTPTAPTPFPTPTGQADGRVRVLVNWPSRTGRLAPALAPLASQSVDVVLQDNDHKEVRTHVLAVRPPQTPTSAGDDASTSTVIFSPVPPGSYSITAAAYPVAQPAADGSTVAQATTAAPIPVTVTSDQTQEFALSLRSDITKVSLNRPDSNPKPPGFVGLIGPQPIGDTFTIIPTATNTAGAVVLTRPETFVYTSSDPSVASVDAGGTVTNVAPGIAVITVTETESGTTVQSQFVVAAATP